MNISKIYIDLDGVLADFDRGLIEQCGIQPEYQCFATHEYYDNMFAAMRKQEHFYYHLKPMADAKELFDALLEKYGSRCEILSGIPSPKRGILNAQEDKINWVHELFSPDIKINLVLTAQKTEFCLGREYVLIDDSFFTACSWNKCGGTAIFHMDAQSTLKDLARIEMY